MFQQVFEKTLRRDSDFYYCYQCSNRYFKLQFTDMYLKSIFSTPVQYLIPQYDYDFSNGTLIQLCKSHYIHYLLHTSTIIYVQTINSRSRLYDFFNIIFVFISKSTPIFCLSTEFILPGHKWLPLNSLALEIILMQRKCTETGPVDHRGSVGNRPKHLLRLPLTYSNQLGRLCPPYSNFATNFETVLQGLTEGSCFNE